MGNGFRGIDGGKIRRYYAGQAQGTRPRPSEPPQGDEKGGREVSTPSTGELLVREAKSAERLEIMAMAEKAKTIEEFRRALEERHSASK